MNQIATAGDNATLRNMFSIVRSRDQTHTGSNHGGGSDHQVMVLQISVDARWAEFRDALKKLHQERIVLVHAMNQMSKTLLAGPQPYVNYGKLTAPAPEITAQVEQIDKIIFTIAKGMFFALVDDERVEPDRKLHHLLLRKKDKISMVQLIDQTFGPVLEDKNASRIVSSAWVIKYGLTRPNYKAADEL